MLLFQRYEKNKRKRSMTKNTDYADSVLCRMCAEGVLDGLVDDYLVLCSESVRTGEASSKTRTRQRLPNPAGFCRYLNTGLSDMAALAEHFPHEYDKLIAIFEDEALNSDVSPTLLSAYFKKRLSYSYERLGERDAATDGGSKEVRFCFEHDIFADGE